MADCRPGLARFTSSVVCGINRVTCSREQRGAARAQPSPESARLAC
jgi:hypothetical protein